MSSLLRKHEEFKKSVVAQPVYKKPTVHQNTPPAPTAVQFEEQRRSAELSEAADLPAAIEELAAENKILTINNKDNSPRILFYNRYQGIFKPPTTTSKSKSKGDVETLDAPASSNTEGSECNSKNGSAISEEFKSIWFGLRVPDETDLGFEMDKAGLKQMQVDKRKQSSLDDDKKKLKTKNRRIKITNTHLEGIDLTKDYVPNKN
ncbi:Transcription initiation factor IIE subunit beta [Smittium culicis]|uniref:Transcription initiation factor IIE subunit beta n=1 Tax=Smittium culicis TaxID=133412 RepID=A0A1R1YNZ7_9FUNG|nr:Transcription initiation factor IIE subunit beta [Smittium culicis]